MMTSPQSVPLGGTVYVTVLLPPQGTVLVAYPL